MVWQTNVLLQLPVRDLTYYFFVFFSTICSYNFHWYLTPSDYSSSERILWGARHKTLQLTLCAVGAIGAACTFWLLRTHWLVLSGAALLTFLYSAPKLPQRAFMWLRRIAIGKTMFLTFVWTYVSTLLPVLIAGHAITAQVIFLTMHRFFLVYAICILFDHRDLEEDKKEGIRSLITYMNKPGLRRLYYVSLTLAATSAICLYPIDHLWIITLLVPVLVTALLTRYAWLNRSDYFFYFVLDGLMMFSALLHALWLIAITYSL